MPSYLLIRFTQPRRLLLFLFYLRSGRIVPTDELSNRSLVRIFYPSIFNSLFLHNLHWFSIHAYEIIEFTVLRILQFLLQCPLSNHSLYSVSNKVLDLIFSKQMTPSMMLTDPAFSDMPHIAFGFSFVLLIIIGIGVRLSLLNISHQTFLFGLALCLRFFLSLLWFILLFLILNHLHKLNFHRNLYFDLHPQIF